MNTHDEQIVKAAIDLVEARRALDSWCAQRDEYRAANPYTGGSPAKTWDELERLVLCRPEGSR